MRDNLKYLSSYIPWFFVLFVFYIFITIFLWLADVSVFNALLIPIIFVPIILFFIISITFIEKEKRKIKIYKAFLSNPEKNIEDELERLSNFYEKEIIKELAKTLYQKQKEIEKANSLLSEYEEYVETWIHEIKTPLSLFSLVIDNQSNSLSSDVIFKLDYVKTQIQENISQILFYYRIKSNKKDFLFENIDLQESINIVLENFKPLLLEKNFEIKVGGVCENIYSDNRSFEFILSQVISNAIKYSNKNPRLEILVKKENKHKIITIKDNGCGVKKCDLPFIFEKGFTGYSGNKRKKSTGMGLYLVKKLADDLKIDIEVKTNWLEGFEITFYFND